MRTTLRLSDDVFRAFKHRAASRGTTFAAEVEAALRADLMAQSSSPSPLDLPHLDGGRPLIDLTSHRAIDELEAGRALERQR